MTSDAHFSQTQLEAIDAAITRFEALESQRRRIEAEQLLVLGEALDAATVVPGGSSGGAELGFRSLRMELATAMHESEHTAGRLLQTAYDARRSFPAALQALGAGEISMGHLRVVTSEGAPLTVGDGELKVEKRERYERRVLEVARQETPNRLRPVARRLAAHEQRESLEEQHERAAAQRCLRLVEAEDGMADLIAHLPAVDAHAIYDRVARIAKKTARAGGAGGSVAGGAVGGVAGGAGAGGASVAGGAVTNASDGPNAQPAAAGQPHPGLQGTEAPPRTGSGQVDMARRPISAVRVDVYRDLLLGANDDTATAADGVAGRVQVLVSEAVLGLRSPLAVAIERSEAGAGSWEGGETGETSEAGENWETGGTGQASEAAETGPPRFAPESDDGSEAGGGGERVAELIGYGPLAEGIARRVAAEATAWDLLAVDSAGNLRSVDRYRPTPAIRRYLGARDQHCRAPGCRVPTHRCDVDHTVAAEDGGPTSVENLAHLCRGHHMLKHHSDWRVEQEPNGTMVWTSPTGRTHRDTPASRVRFKRAD
ncbi:HNH endonuclease signature motif containing protein [Leucobacter aridicollis]|uniref:HNH endonuclease signature motif containing protein n=1 Tax=Leucobacter aridicollis TaxID=283878 RepID=UPI0021698636|nr:HNH endonuclease signature motif containing protein [Leucobacter aridicollis]MCS3428257.1 hypothetical protein [Leucobacter aridicollis]